MIYEIYKAYVIAIIDRIYHKRQISLSLWNVCLDMQTNAHDAFIPKPPKYQYNTESKVELVRTNRCLIWLMAGG